MLFRSVGAERGDAVADLEAVSLPRRRDGDDGAFYLLAEDAAGGGGVEAGAQVGVDVVYAHEGGFDEEFPCGWGGDWEVGVVFQDFEAAGVGDLDAAHCGGEGGHGCKGGRLDRRMKGGRYSSCGGCESCSGELMDGRLVACSCSRIELRWGRGVEGAWRYIPPPRTRTARREKWGKLVNATT